MPPKSYETPAEKPIKRKRAPRKSKPVTTFRAIEAPSQDPVRYSSIQTKRVVTFRKPETHHEYQRQIARNATMAINPPKNITTYDLYKGEGLRDIKRIIRNNGGDTEKTVLLSDKIMGGIYALSKGEQRVCDQGILMQLSAYAQVQPDYKNNIYLLYRFHNAFGNLAQNQQQTTANNPAITMRFIDMDGVATDEQKKGIMFESIVTPNKMKIILSTTDNITDVVKWIGKPLLRQFIQVLDPNDTADNIEKQISRLYKEPVPVDLTRLERLADETVRATNNASDTTDLLIRQQMASEARLINREMVRTNADRRRLDEDREIRRQEREEDQRLRQPATYTGPAIYTPDTIDDREAERLEAELLQLIDTDITTPIKPTSSSPPEPDFSFGVITTKAGKFKPDDSLVGRYAIYQPNHRAYVCKIIGFQTQITIQMYGKDPKIVQQKHVSLIEEYRPAGDEDVNYTVQLKAFFPIDRNAITSENIGFDGAGFSFKKLGKSIGKVFGGDYQEDGAGFSFKKLGKSIGKVFTGGVFNADLVNITHFEKLYIDLPTKKNVYLIQVN